MAGTPWAPKSFRICCTIASQSDKDSRPQHGYPAIKATEEWLSSHQGQKRSGYPAIIEQKWLSSHQIFPETNRFSLKITGFHGSSWVFIGLHGSSWVFMGLHGSSWVFMRLHVNFASFLSFFPGAFLSSSPATIFISLPVSVQAIQPYFTSSDCCFAICALAASAKDSSYARCKTWQGQGHSHLFSHSPLQPVKQCTFSVMSTAIWV